MFNSNLFRTYLKNIGIHTSYQIWLFSPELSQSILIDGTVESQQVPEATHSFKRSTLQYIKNRETHLYFNYPDYYQIFVHLLEPIEFDDNDLQMIFQLLYPCYAENALKASKHKLDKIIESIGNTTSSLDLEDVFSKVLSNTLDVIPNADLGTLWLYDATIERLVCKASVGKLLSGIRKMKFKLNEGVIGHTFQMKEPKLFCNRDLSIYSQEIGKGMTMENIRHWDSTYDFTKHVKSMLTVPIIVGERTECVMILCQIKKKYCLTEQDLHLLQGFSSQIGIAVRNAHLYTDIRKQNELLVERDEIHSTLTMLSMQNKGVSKVVRALNKMVAHPLLFVDLIEDECVPSTKRLPASYSFKDLGEFLTTIETKVFYDLVKSDDNAHYIYPIRSGKVILGCLIIEGKIPLSQLDHIAIEQGISVLTLELVKKQNLVEYFYKKKRELFNEMLHMKDSSACLLKARELGINESANLVSIIFQFSHYTEPQLLELHVRRLIAQIKKELSPHIQILFGHHNKVTLLTSLSTGLQLADLKRQLDTLLKEWDKIAGIILHAGMGSVYNGLHLLGKTYEESKSALSYLLSRKMPGFIEYSEIGVNRLFINQNTKEIQDYLVDVFKPLRSHSGDSMTLEKTLLTYFESNQSAAKTAKGMHIHINTLYQRLKKIEECLNISFENPENVLRLQLACYLRSSYEVAEE